MNLSISNIAWGPESDPVIYRAMQELGYTGLEIAPTRIFPEAPYEHLKEAAAFAKGLREQYGLSVCSMQSIWYGRTERLFASREERDALLSYTKKAIDFAQAVDCPNLVFGSPKNRYRPKNAPLEPVLIFFRELESYAASHGTVLSMEPNPPLYHTNFINTTPQACRLAQDVLANRQVSAPPGFAVNLDLGTVIENGEDLSLFSAWLPWIHHIHISEPGLCPLKMEHLALHRTLAALVKDAWAGNTYEGYVSIEMGRVNSLPELLETMRSIRELF